jgi:hypothetical protein
MSKKVGKKMQWLGKAFLSAIFFYSQNEKAVFKKVLFRVFIK